MKRASGRIPYSDIKHPEPGSSLWLKTTGPTRCRASRNDINYMSLVNKGVREVLKEPRIGSVEAEVTSENEKPHIPSSLA